MTPISPNSLLPSKRASTTIAAIFNPREASAPSRLQKAPLARRLPNGDDSTRSNLDLIKGGIICIILDVSSLNTLPNYIFRIACHEQLTNQPVSSLHYFFLLHSRKN